MSVSVVLSTYNGEKYVVTQMDTLRQQTLTPDEVIIWDDGSTDNTCRIVEDYIAQHNLTNWHFKKNKTNAGWRKNFQDLIQAASGDYIFTCDQDDIWHERKIEIMTNIMENNNEIMVLGCEYIKFSDETVSLKCIDENTEKIKLKKFNVADRNIFETFPGCMMCIRKLVAQDMLTYKSDIFPHDALAQVIGKAYDGLYICSVPLAAWRVYRNSSFAKEVHTNKSKFYIQNANVRKQLLEVYCSLVKEKSLNPAKIEKMNIAKINKWIMLKSAYWENPNIGKIFYIFRYSNMYSNFKVWMREFKDVSISLIKK